MEMPKKKETGENMSLHRLLTSLDVSSSSIAQQMFLMLEKRESIEQKYVVLIANIIISCHQN